MGDKAQDKQRREQKIGAYLVGNIIGKGGFGCVYKALDQQKALFVAIKQVRVEMLNSLDLGFIEMEISLLSTLKHRNIVKYIDSIRTDSHLNIVLEFVEGGSLASILKKFGAFPETLCAIYTLQILKGLEYLHQQGVIHRDIKGANVLTTKTGIVKLADFGVAMKQNEVDSSKKRVVGTPYWMAPEIVEMSPPTYACDVWSVGSTVVEMITEKPPYADLPHFSALYRIVSDPHPPVPDNVSQALETFLLHCYEKNPNHRASATDLLEDEWIQANKSHSKDITRNMITPPTSKEQDNEEDCDEEAEVLYALMENITANNELDRVVEGLANAAGSAANGAPANPSEAPDRGDEASAPNTKERTAGTASTAQETSGTSVPAKVSSGTNSGTAPSVPQTVEHGEDSATGPSESPQNQHNFMFIDYYRKHCGAAGRPNTMQDRTASDYPLSRVTSLEGVTPGQEDEMVRVVSEPSNSRLRQTDEVSTVSYTKGFPYVPPASPVPLPRRLFSLGRAAYPVQLKHFDEQLPMHTETSFENPGVRQHGKERQREAEIKQLLGDIRPFEEPDVLMKICKRLMELLHQGSSNEAFAMHAVPIVEMLQVTDPTLLRTVLKVVNQIVEGNQYFQEIFAMVGLIPGVIKFARPHHSRPLRYEAACFVSLLCHTSARSLQMLVACGGLEAIVDLVSHDYYDNRDLVWLALDALQKVFEFAAGNGQKSDFCRILAKHGLCGHLCLLVDTLASDIHEKGKQYLQVVVDLLLFFAKEGDAVVKVYMAKGHVLEGLISSLEFLPLDLAVQICKTFKWLAQEPSVLNMLENAGVVPVLVHFLSLQCRTKEESEETEEASELGTIPPASDACTHQCLLALFWLCHLSRPRQEQAALAGVVPLLKELVERRHSLRVHAFAMLCDMTCASLAARRILWAEDGSAFFVCSLPAPDLQTFALEALVSWLGVREHKADWCARVEGVLLEGPDFMTNLVQLFQAAQATVFIKVLDALLKLVRVSERINAAFADSQEFFEELVRRLKVAHHFGGSCLPSELGSSRHNSPENQLHSSSMQASTEGCAEEAAQVTTVALSAAVAAAVSVPSRAPLVRRLASEPATAVCSGDDVRARKNLLRLVLLICQAQRREKLAALCQRYLLQSLMQGVVQEERRRQRVILEEIALQLLDLLHEVLPAEARQTTI